MSPNPSNPWKVVEEDDFFSQFLKDGDKQDVTKSALFQTLAVSEQLAKLSEGINILDKELLKQVLENHEDLVSQATWVERLQTLLASMHSQTQCVLSGVERLRARIMEPFSRMESHTLVLSRLHETSDLLRRIARLQQLSKKLQTCTDHVKAAAILNEIDQLSEDVDLSGLEILESDQSAVQKHRTTVHEQAQAMLKNGLEALDHQKVTTALLVFNNLGSVNAELSGIIQKCLSKLSAAISEALNVQALTHVPASSEPSRAKGAPGRVVMPSLGNTSSFRSKLWSALENLFELSIFTCCSQVEVLQSVVQNQCNELGNRLQLADEHKNMTDKLWSRVMKLVSQELITSAQSSTYVKQALEAEYPKLLRLYVDLSKRLVSAHKKAIIETNTNDLSQESSRQYQIERELIAQFENAYLSRSVSRLLDPVNLMFSESKAPTHENVDGLVRAITSELSVSLVDEVLSRTIAKNISKAVSLFCIKCEQLIATGGEATQVIDIPSQAQAMNAAAANILHYLSGQLERVLSNMGATLAAGPASIIRESLSGIEKLVTSHVLNPLLSSISDAIEAILLTMHDEDYSADEGTSLNSLYMKELQAFIGRAVNLYLSPFDDQILVVKCAASVATRCIDLFLRLACLVRPLGKVGALKLSSDFEKIEQALQPFAGRQPSADLGWGKQLRMLRSLRTLIGLPAPQVASSPAVGTALPYSLVLTALFSQAPAELLSPHQSAGWSISRLSQWLDSHPAERDRLQLVGGCLQRYQQAVRQSGQTEFHPVYPIMVSLLEAGMAQCTT